uniref:Uncharacterized protein n=1 Tax=Trichoderma spinulosum TaxID=1491020 RepID=A0A223FZ48_TRISN|nr:hypothetical protein [Trichoderma spinulosum]
MSTPRVPPIAALAALEPRPGGQWIMNEQEGDATSVSYVMDNGSEAITYTLHQCRTEEDIRKRCASFVYEYTDDGMGPLQAILGTGSDTCLVVEGGSSHQTVREAATRPRNPPEVESLLYHSQDETAMLQYPMGQIQQPPAGNLPFNLHGAFIQSSQPQTQTGYQFGETALAPSSQLYQHDHRYLLSNGQQLPQEVITPGTVQWPLNNGLYPNAAVNTSIAPATTTGSAQDTTTMLGAWQQSWDHVNPNIIQGSEEDWDVFFSQI